MKKSLLLLAAGLLGVSLCAEELQVEPPLKSLRKEWDTGAIVGKNTHAMYVGGKAYKDCWSYWYAESGLTPETAVWKPLNAINPDLVAGKFWGKYVPILAPGLTKNGKGFTWPGMIRDSFYARGGNCTFGAAYAFKNPFDSDVICYIEGRLRHPKEAKVYVYIKTADGKLKHLTDSGKPGALFIKDTKHRNGRIENRQYLKLQVETKLQAGETIMFAGFRPDCAGKPASAKNEVGFLSIDDRWGPAFQPKIFFEK